ncbi:hypothetical protein [Pontibacillus litoralis]|uniref:Uncharacterized protein n=1 Tax=Pontibacillus litoralis JSM 072002 TaxID=1385512 RepID=A0A0A5G0K4_9BACI|nr:hypothetical protein [Pontibacillus litoralis]KGX85559.1 hypothetical protein N784_08605 [Pontibacillus litoralis JSM 072002]
MEHQFDWKRDLQRFVDDVIQDLYYLPQTERSMLATLEIINNKQEQLNEHVFSHGCYYIKLAQVMDHLMQQLTYEQLTNKEAWYCAFWNKFDEDTGEEVILDHVVIQQSDALFSVQKYFVECAGVQLQQFQRKVVECSKQMFQRVPDVIEAIILSTGQRLLFWPNEEHISIKSS